MQMIFRISDRLKILIFAVKNFAEQKFQVQRNAETGHFSDPAVWVGGWLVITSEAEGRASFR